MTIYTHFASIPSPEEVVNAHAITDQLKERLQGLSDAMDEAGAKLMLYYQEKGLCRLAGEGPEGLQAEVQQLVGSAETRG